MYILIGKSTKPGKRICMFRHCISLAIVLVTVSCGSPQNSVESRQSTSSVAPKSDHFAGLDACFILYNVKTAAIEKIVGEERCKRRFPPCSSFKVPLAVMAFDAGILKDENQILKWDGKVDVREAANKDHNAKSWMSDSIVWFSQRLTPKLTKQKFQNYLDKFEYGNRDLTAGITDAWLVSPNEDSVGLKITAFEQLEFMKKLWAGTLPASPRAMKLTRDITYIETSPHGFKFNGKTGSGFHDQERKVHFGWFISHLENGNQEYITIANFSDRAPTDAAGYGGLRLREITERVLADLGLW